MIFQISFLLLPVAATCGWLWGRRDSHSQDRQLDAQLRGVYFQGLNYLIDEKPDKAVDVFIRLTDIDGDTVETHLALGSLFRRRGEVDRAIRIHQNLIARPQLLAKYRLLALFALAQDYFSAGVLDRAERLLLDLIKCNSKDEAALRLLRRIYEQERDWSKAVQISKKLQTVASLSMQTVTAHYYCEMAETFIEKSQYLEALRYLKQALSADKNCVRAYLLWASIEYQRHQYQQAIRYYKKVEALDIEFIFSVLHDYCYCYRKLCLEDEITSLLIRLVKFSPEFYLHAMFDESSPQQSDMLVSPKLLLQQISTKPSLYVFDCLLSSSIDKANNQAACPDLSELRHQLRSVLERGLVYQCNNCGFNSQSLLWVCPSCHQWSSLRIKLLLQIGVE